MQALGERARQSRIALRQTLGLERPPSQTDIANALGWSQAKYSKVELGQQERLSVDDVHALAVHLRVDEYWLFTGRHSTPISDLAMQINRLELDHWGEAAVLETARREAKRYAEQQASKDAEVSRAVAAMAAAGVPSDMAERAARSLASLPSLQESDESPAGAPRESGRQQA